MNRFDMERSSNFWGRMLLGLFKLRGWIRGRNNVICYEGRWPRGLRIKINGDNNRILIGKGTRLKDVFFNIKTSGVTLSIGDHCDFYRTYASLSGDITIGNFTTIRGIGINAIEGGKVEIGEDCMFSDEIIIMSGDGHGIYTIEGRERVNPPKAVFIGDHCWIGKRVVILKGAKIGAGSVIGFNSIVTGEIPENTVAAGVPAKTIKRGIIWTRRPLVSLEVK